MNGRRMSLAVLWVISGFLQHMRQQRGGVPIGQGDSTLSKLPVNKVFINICYPSQSFTNDIKGEIDEGNHGDHNNEVLQYGDDVDGGGGEEDREGDDEVEDRGELEYEDKESVGV